jgi:hypothetical protein
VQADQADSERESETENASTAAWRTIAGGISC